MTTQTKPRIVSVLLALLAATLMTGCQCFRKQPCPGPIVLVHPASQIAQKGNTVTMSVDARNRSPYKAEPVEYQWYFAFAPIAGATTKTLTLNNVQPASAGRYFVIVSGHGTTKSCDADLVVNTPSGLPVGNSGTLTIGTSSFSSAAATCFPNPPWDRSFPITDGNFVGPTAPGNATPPFPNTDKLTTVTLSTCDTANGTTLETGIVIVRTTNPLGDKVCVANNCTLNPPAPLLTSNQRSITGSNKYKATIVYKSGTATGLNFITVKWSYP